MNDALTTGADLGAVRFAHTAVEDVPPRPAGPHAISNHFPPMVRDALIAASRVYGAHERAVAINRATDKARFVYPELFN